MQATRSAICFLFLPLRNSSLAYYYNFVIFTGRRLADLSARTPTKGALTGLSDDRADDGETHYRRARPAVVGGPAAAPDGLVVRGPWAAAGWSAGAEARPFSAAKSSTRIRSARRRAPRFALDARRRGLKRGLAELRRKNTGSKAVADDAAFLLHPANFIALHVPTAAADPVRNVPQIMSTTTRSFGQFLSVARLVRS